MIFKEFISVTPAVWPSHFNYLKRLILKIANMKTQILLIAIVILFTSCAKDRITADGNIIREARNTGSFKEVRSSGSNNIHISYGPEFKVEVRGSANLVSRYKTKVYNNTLDLGYEFVSVRRDDIEVFITIPKISGVSLSGSGNVDLSGPFQETDLFNLRISGSAKVGVDNTFEASEVAVNISGSGDADLRNIICKEAGCEERLHVQISGSGDVYYIGNPAVQSDISGSGKVIRQ
jgi:hypothetical protein